MAPLVLLVQEEREGERDLQVLPVFEALTDWLVLLVHQALLAKLAHLVFLEAPAPRVTWVVLGLKVVKDFKVHEVKQANPVYLVKQDPLDLPEKMDWQETKVVRVRLVLPERLVSQEQEDHPGLLEVLVLLELKDILVSLVVLVLRENKVSKEKVVLLDLVDCQVQLVPLVNVERSVLGAQVELLDHLEKEAHLAVEVFQGLMDHLGRKVKLVIEDLLAQTDQKAKSEILVVLAPQVCKDFVVSLVAQVLPVNLVALASVVYPVLMAKMVNKVLRVFKVCLDLWVFLESVAHREKTAKTVIPDLPVNLDLVVMPERTEQLVRQGLLDRQGLTANEVLLVLLVPVVSKVCRVLLAHLVTQVKTANPVCRDLLGCLVQVDLEVSVVSLESAALLVHLVHPANEDLLV